MDQLDYNKKVEEEQKLESKFDKEVKEEYERELQKLKDAIVQGRLEKDCLAWYTNTSVEEIKQIYDFLKVNSFKEMLDQFKYFYTINQHLVSKLQAIEQKDMWHHPPPFTRPDGLVEILPSIKFAYYDVDKKSLNKV